jgi:hypothetical protein
MKSIYLLDTNTISEPIKKIPNEKVLEKIWEVFRTSRET